jgi:hypothetical protein
MTTVLVATCAGCRVFVGERERPVELAGRNVGAMAQESSGSCLAVVDGKEIWRREFAGEWSKLATSPAALQSIVSVNGVILSGGMDEAIMIRVSPTGSVDQMRGFDQTPGRHEWFAGGPPLGVRSLAATADGSVLLAAVHVGGIPRSLDGGETWAPTIPVAFDVHEVRAHPTIANTAVAAAAVGLCVSYDAGRNWKVISEGLKGTSSLAAALLQDEALFSVQEGPFAKRSQLWRWPLGAERAAPVRDGLPEWLEGKIDTNLIAAGAGRAAVVDAGGNLWLSSAGSAGWERVATGLPYTSGVVIL